MSILEDVSHLPSAEQKELIDNSTEALGFAKEATFFEKLGAGIEDESFFFQAGSKFKDALTNGMYQGSIYAMDYEFLNSPDKDKLIYEAFAKPIKEEDYPDDLESIKWFRED